MPNTEKVYQKENQQKYFKFFAIAMPMLFGLWVCSSLFFFYLNPRDFSELPQNLREEFITSLFFYKDTWHFPLTLVDIGTTKIPLGLTDNIPLMALLFKILKVQYSQYFGFWFTLSTILYTFFAYRLCRYIFQKQQYLLIGLSSLLFLLLPFIWYHPIYVPWLAGQWVILWAYSLYFRRKSYIPTEWIWVMIFASLIHPFFTFVCFWIMTADLIHLYIYNHSISSIKAVSSFGKFFTACFVTMGISGVFYLPTYLSDIQIPPLTFNHSTQNTYNISFLQLGYGITTGVILIFILATIYRKKFKKYIYYYRALVMSLSIFFFYGILGGISINDTTIFTMPQWIYKYSAPLFTSGPKFIIPIFLLAPIIIVSGIYRLEQHKKYLGYMVLIAIIIFQTMFQVSLINKPTAHFQPLSDSIQKFATESENIFWIFPNKIPMRPAYYEQFAYYAYLNNKHINAMPIIRFSSGYKDSLIASRDSFLHQEFQKNTMYIINKHEFPQDFLKLGDTIIFEDVILFKPYMEKIL